MFGEKIIEFDNSEGTIEDFNRIFPSTPLEGEGDVEIHGIVDSEIYTSTVFRKEVEVNGVVTELDFGYANFINKQSFVDGSIRFKYFARDEDGNVLATAKNFKELGKKMNCSENIVKSRFKSGFNPTTQKNHQFNVTRIDL